LSFRLTQIGEAISPPVGGKKATKIRKFINSLSATVREPPSFLAFAVVALLVRILIIANTPFD
jgi:predicted membrane protein